MGPVDARPPRRWAALAGVVAGGALVAVAELLALLFGSGSAPFVAVGGAFIDVIPPWVKDMAIALFGTWDKVVLFAAMGLVYAGLCALAGLLQRRRAGLGAALLGGLGMFAAIIVLTRAQNTIADVMPTLVGTLAAVPLLGWLLQRQEGRTAGSTPRRALAPLAVTAVAALVVGGGARALNASRQAARAVAETFRIPTPATRAAEIPAAASVDVEGMPPFLTPNAQFYRIDTALAVPRIDPADWSLRIHGLVDRELTLSFEELLAEEAVEAHVTLTCVSNSVGGDLAGNATWIGVPVRTLLERAGVQEGADMVLSRSQDGFTASTPLEALTDDRDSLLAVAMNGEPLPREHGFPVRMVVPGLYGYVSATKWLTELRVTRFADDTAYWTDRGWAERGPIKIASRVDVPRAFAALTPDAEGTVMLGGTAWAQQRGIARVEVRIDDGDWREAELGAEVSADTWTQWALRWEDATPGDHTVTVRATDGEGEQQTEETAQPVPDGASGWHAIQFSVE